MTVFNLNRDQYLEFEKISLGALHPVSGFMNEEEFTSVVETMRLPSGEVFSLPVVFSISKDQAVVAKNSHKITLVHEDTEVGFLEPQSVFSCDKKDVAQKVFGTTDKAHPGVRHFLSEGEYFVGGPIKLTQRVGLDISDYELTPKETRQRFKELGWKTIVGFQTRNVPHRAHEYLLRVGLEICDGLFVQPLVGKKKQGDYTPQSIMAAYTTLIDKFFPSDRVLLGILSTAMRYAGPREAVFHAIIRRNYGCTHFIVGRDHAGVGSFYQHYEAHELVRRFESELGIVPLCLSGPYHCSKCGGIVTERTCCHRVTNPTSCTEISGTIVRSILNGGEVPDEKLIRSEIVESIKNHTLFI